MKKKIIRVMGSCLLGNCKCLPLDGIEYDAVLMDIPPYHDGCTCLIVEEESRWLHLFDREE
jgi:hypothetical protein